MPQFATAVELSTYLTGNTTPTAEFTAQANLLLTLISADIQAAAGNVITPTEESTHLLPGVWGRDLELPQRPVISVSAVSVNGTPIAAATYAWNSRQILRRGADGWGFDDNPFEDWNERGMGGAGWQSGQHWGGPASTIAVTYEFGRAETPDAIRSLALRVAGRVIENPTSVSSEQLAVYSVTYGKEAIGGATHLNPHEIRMLRKRYGRTGGTFHPRARMNPKRLMKFPVGVVSVVVDDDDRDEMGNPRETTTTADYVGYYWQSRTDEDTANAEIVTDHYGLVLEAAAEGLVHAGDRITIGPLTFSVDGEPWPAVNPRTGALEYVQMKIVRTD